MIMKVRANWNRIVNPCCRDFESLYHYNYFNYDDEKNEFYFENEEEKPLKYCMFCGKKIVSKPAD